LYKPVASNSPLDNHSSMVVVGCSGEWFICRPCTLVVDALSVHGQVVSLIGCLSLDSAHDMVDTVCSVVGDGLEYIKELLFQGKEVVVVWLADDGWLGVESILEKLCDV
jgi:hypothetical protein